MIQICLIEFLIREREREYKTSDSFFESIRKKPSTRDRERPGQCAHYRRYLSTTPINESQWTWCWISTSQSFVHQSQIVNRIHPNIPPNHCHLAVNRCHHRHQENHHRHSLEKRVPVLVRKRFSCPVHNNPVSFNRCWRICIRSPWLMPIGKRANIGRWRPSTFIFEKIVSSSTR